MTSHGSELLDGDDDDEWLDKRNDSTVVTQLSTTAVVQVQLRAVTN